MKQIIYHLIDIDLLQRYLIAPLHLHDLMIWANCRAAGAFGSVKSNNLGNVSEVLESLIEGYDIRLRPKFGGTTSSLHKSNTLSYL